MNRTFEMFIYQDGQIVKKEFCKDSNERWSYLIVDGSVSYEPCYALVNFIHAETFEECKRKVLENINERATMLKNNIQELKIEKLTIQKLDGNN